jgi:D,D-heptose 1,7-bisphosphate phosphatase
LQTPNQCAILVGGFGTRLGSLTAETPKPLLECGDRPFLAWVLRELSRFGISRIILLAGFRSDRIESFVSDVRRWLPKDVEIEVSVEPSPAGTAGALWHARELLHDRFLMINGDSWFDTNLARFLSTANHPSHAVGRVLLRQIDDASRYGTASLLDDKIVTFREKANSSDPGLISSGIYLFQKSILDFITPNCSLEVDVLPKLAKAGRLDGRVLDGYFIDIGIPADYQRASVEIPERLNRPAVFFDRDGVLNVDEGWVGVRERFVWTEDAKDAIRFVTDLGMHAFVVTNQAGVARGFYSEADVQRLHEELTEELLSFGATFDDVSYCPYHPEAPVLSYRKDSPFRKPGPGMILELIDRWKVRASQSILIGDKDSDLQAAVAAGIDGHLYRGGSLLEFVRPLVRSAPAPI